MNTLTATAPTTYETMLEAVNAIAPIIRETISIIWRGFNTPIIWVEGIGSYSSAKEFTNWAYAHAATTALNRGIVVGW